MILPEIRNISGNILETAMGKFKTHNPYENH